MDVLLQLVTERFDPISAAIRFSTRSAVSHAEFVDPATGSTFGARCTGVKWRSAHASRRYTCVLRFTAPAIDQAFKWALTQAGKSYDFSAIGGIALDRNWRDSRRWFCSELIAAAFEAVSSPLLNPSANVWRITPRDLLLSMNLAAVSAISIPN
jgi:uncharacterized protein YycO